MKEEQDNLLTPAEAGRKLSRSPTTLAIWRRQGTGPRYIRLGTRMIMYAPKDIEDYVNAHRSDA